MSENIIHACLEGSVLRWRVLDCRGLLSSMRGLMFHDLKGIDGALIHGNDIWMPFVATPLFLFFLDEHNRIVSIDRAVPLTLNSTTWKSYRDARAVSCLELVPRPGLDDAKIGDVILWIK